MLSSTAPAIDHPLLPPSLAAGFDVDVAGVPTRFIIAPFADATFVAASQTGGVGTMLRVTRAGGGRGEEPVRLPSGGDDDDDAPTPSSTPLLDVATLTGRRGVPALEACARALALRRGVGGRPLVVALALKDDGAESVAGVLAALDGRL